ncbi:hypothetical protein AMAG_07615 [Allomyces macrogynus ATCC 38327]|uniref:Fucosyltransferase n=1 Tax=Allomyces macrogynus (strain ATCC 38327) TaxID=578462 RepID=A0A0L0SIQ7_ALLM3|nr:hypothetical protein AMAG_07615 [Allomyces macrogynus ATCC 38327]|eukprot:KNE62393.1 hypothetical protein AMAG_07615 [Allomyces macrogynus ATCC 38327]
MGLTARTPSWRAVLSALIATAALIALIVRRHQLSSSWDEYDEEIADADDGDGPAPPRIQPILVWSPWYGRNDFWEGRRIDYCGVGQPACVVTHDRSKLAHSSVVMFHNADVNSYDLPPREKGKPWILFGRDAPMNNPWQTEPEHMRLFDLTMTHRTDSDFPIPWFDKSLVENALRPLDKARIFGKFNKWNDLPPIVWIEDDCTPPSQFPALVKELMKHVKIHSYGKCLNTLPSGRDLEQAESRTRLVEPYKFMLVTEYRNCAGFVQDKLMEAFRAGVVPIVDGPRNYSAIAPTPKAILHVDDFKSIADLAAYVTRVSKDRAAYLAHLDYRIHRKTVPAAWRQYWSTTMEKGEWSGWCHVCRFAVERQFEQYRAAFKDHASFVRAFRYRLSDQMTWYDADPRAPPSEHVIAFLDGIKPPPTDVVDARSMGAVHAPFKVQWPDQTCVEGKWAALAAKQEIETKLAAVRRQARRKQLMQERAAGQQQKQQARLKRLRDAGEVVDVAEDPRLLQQQHQQAPRHPLD